MAVRAAALPKMWAALNHKPKLDPATSMDKNLYLGCAQTNFTPSPKMVLQQGKVVEELKCKPLEKIDSAPQDKKGKNAFADHGAPSDGKSTPRGVESGSKGEQEASSLSEQAARKALLAEKWTQKDMNMPCVDMLKLVRKNI